jgi:hypothetical protein
MKLKITLISIVLLIFGCDDGNEDKRKGIEWTKLGLDGKIVNEMQISGSTLYVATTTGLFKKQIGDKSNFLPLGFDSKNVEAIQVIDDEEIIVSLFDKTGTEAPGLYKTINGGETWAPVNSDFGGDHPEPVYDLTVHPNDESVLYATGFSVLAKSTDQGVTWEPVYGSWSGFATGMSVVVVNPNDAHELWAGGQGAIENGFLIRSKNESDWDTWNDLVDNPTVVKEITFADSNKDQVFVGFEGALLKTIDGGGNWQTLIESEENKFYFGICLQQGNSDRIYAGGWLKTPDPQPLILSVSSNGGQSWEDFEFPNETYGGILEMQIKNDGDTDVLFVGLDKGGVYQIDLDLDSPD